MKKFFSQYSYSIVKMFINQFAIGIFGAVLWMAASAASGNGKAFPIVVSVFSILFYLFLIYNMTWEIGAKDCLSVEYKKQAYKPHCGLIMALVANIPNALVAIAFTVSAIFAQYDWAKALRGGVAIVTFVLEGMYIGLGVATGINGQWWFYFLLIIPSLLTAWLAYYLGHKNFRFMALFGVGAKPNQGNKKS